MPADVIVEKNLRIVMRDGDRLAADVYRPAGAGPWPAVASCYPYHKDGMIGAYFAAALKRFARRGYAALLVDCRGTGASDGVGVDALEPIVTMDLYDLVEGIAAQSWCTGKVGMWGISYGGITALKAASLQPPHLAAIAPIYGVTDFYRTWLMPGSRPNLLGSMGAWMSFMQAMNLAPPLYRDPAGDWQRLWQQRLEGHQPYLIDGLDHLDADDAYWHDARIDCSCITTPTFVIAGWRDVFLDDCIRQFEQIRAPKQLLVGPWVHMLPNVSVVEALDHEREILRWFDHWLRAEDTGIMREPAARVYVQGEGGGWRYDEAFPPPGRRERLFLHAGQRLAAVPPSEGGERYRTTAAVGVTAGLWSPLPMGLDYPQDQRPDDALSLTYTSDPLEGALEIAGRPTVRLLLACSWDDPTLVVKLCDVAPDGSSSLVTTGWLAPRLASNAEPNAIPPPVEPQVGTAEPFPGGRLAVEIPFWCTAYRFAPGHRVRLALASGDFPRLWPGRGNGTIDVDHAAAALYLPVVEGGRGPAGVPSFDPPDLSALLSEGPMVFAPSWQVETDVVRGTVGTRAGLVMRFTTPTGAVVDSRHRYAARVGCGERADPVLEASLELSFTQDGDEIVVHASQHMDERELELESAVTVNGEERFHRAWRRAWRAP